MDPRSQSGPDPRCPARGQAARGNIKVHSYPERRFRCTTCRKTFAASTGTPFYRLHKDPALFASKGTALFPRKIRGASGHYFPLLQCLFFQGLRLREPSPQHRFSVLSHF
jgi:hypothetical protein